MKKRTSTHAPSLADLPSDAVGVICRKLNENPLLRNGDSALVASCSAFHKSFNEKSMWWKEVWKHVTDAQKSVLAEHAMLNLDALPEGMEVRYFERLLTSSALTNLRSLSLRYNHMRCNDMGMVASPLAKGSMVNLTNLDLGYNLISDAGLIALSDAISKGSLGALKWFSLEKNMIGNEGMIALTTAIEPTPEKPMGSMRSLTNLHLNSNQIGDAGLAEFSRAIANCAMKLSFLRLHRNNITDDGLAMLIPLFKTKLSNLVYFSIGSGIADMGMATFSAAISGGSLNMCRSIGIVGNPGNKDHIRTECSKRGIFVE